MASSSPTEAKPPPRSSSRFSKLSSRFPKIKKPNQQQTAAAAAALFAVAVAYVLILCTYRNREPIRGQTHQTPVAAGYEKVCGKPSTNGLSLKPTLEWPPQMKEEAAHCGQDLLDTTREYAGSAMGKAKAAAQNACNLCQSKVRAQRTRYPRAA